LGDFGGPLGTFDDILKTFEVLWGLKRLIWRNPGGLLRTQSDIDTFLVLGGDFLWLSGDFLWFLGLFRVLRGLSWFSGDFIGSQGTFLIFQRLS